MKKTHLLISALVLIVLTTVFAITNSHPTKDTLLKENIEALANELPLKDNCYKTISTTPVEGNRCVYVYLCTVNGKCGNEQYLVYTYSDKCDIQ